jgi:hypothetical protein
VSSIDGRIKPKRREMNLVRRNKKGDCVKCENYEPVKGYPCLWKLEAQLDKGVQHINIAIAETNFTQVKKAAKNMNNALCLIRKITAKQRQLNHKLPITFSGKKTEGGKTK